MANVDVIQRSLLREVHKNPDWRPIYEAFKHIMDNLDQQRERTGGDSDLVASTASASSTNFYAGTFIEDQGNLSLFYGGEPASSASFFPYPEVDTVINLSSSYGLNSDALLVRPTSTWLDMASGKISGLSSVKKFGRNSSVGTVSLEPVCNGGVYQTPQASAATALRIAAGGNANDDAAGTGARQITLEGLDENFELVSETLATAGASASSATTATFTRLFRAYVSQSGTYANVSAGSHAGDITIENSGGGTNWAVINGATFGFPMGQSEIGAYSVASGYKAYVFLRQVSIDTGKAISLIFFHRGSIDETSPPYTAMRTKSIVTGLEGGHIENFGEKIVPLGEYEGPCDVGFMAQTSSGSSSEVSVEFEVFMVAI